MTSVITWDATYTDARGRFPATISTDGMSLRLSVLGVTFAGIGFSQLEPAFETPAALLDGFVLSDSTTFNGRMLAACEMALTIPLPLVVDARSVEGALTIDVRLREPGEASWAYEALILTLTFGDGHVMVSSRKDVNRSICFEDHLLALIAKLPPRVSIKSCFTCQYADYSVYGSGPFGCMLCFRNHKAAYDRVETKDDYLEFHDDYDRIVQETWLCPDYAPRRSSAGYRGWPEIAS